MKTLVAILLSFAILTLPLEARRRWVPHAVAGGGTPAWHENTATTDGDVGGYSNAGQIFGGIVTPSASGTCTKAAMWFETKDFSGDVKIALLTTGGTSLGSGTVSVDATPNTYAEVTFTGVSVTSGTSYVVMGIYVGSIGKFGQLSGQTNMGRQNYDQVYASFPNGTVSFATTSGMVRAKIYITP